MACGCLRGGHINQDETPDDALLREIKEETGIEAEILGKDEVGIRGNVKKNLAVPFHANVHSTGDHDHCCLFYICKTKSKKVRINHELNAFEWLAKKDMDKNYIPKDVKEIGLKAFEMIEKFE